MLQKLPHDWEMSPRYRVLDSEVHRVTFAGKTRWQLHLIKQPSWKYSFLWMRPHESGDDAGFVAFSENFHREHIFSGHQKLQTLDREIYRIIGADAFARRFVLNTRGQLRAGNQRAHEILTVRRDGVAACSHAALSNGTPFIWRELKTPLSGAEFARIPAAHIWDELQNLFANPASEANFSRQFARQNTTQRRERIQRTKRGELEQINRLLHDIIIASPQWGELAAESELYLAVDNSGVPRTWEVGCGNSPELETPDFVRVNVRALWTYFEPFDSTVARFLCVRNSDENSLFARTFRPSAHEQLEAQLRLRAWMQTNS